MKFTYPSGSKPLEGYTIKRGIGQGGFGEVYFATSDAGKEVALKLIRRNLDVELRGVTHCLNLKHPNLVGLFDIRSDENDDRWVIMEYVSGESLEDAIDRNPNGIPLEEALHWMHGIAAGVAYLHDKGIVHRDLKPGNIFTDESVVKIGDYGLSKFISCSRRSGQTESVGTVHYMAPEVANGRYGKEIDIYALGIIFCEILTGRVPFEGESIGEVLMKHLTAEPDLSGLNPPFRDAVEKALKKDPDERVGSVAELMAMLPKPAEGAFQPLPRVEAVSVVEATMVEPHSGSIRQDDKPPMAQLVERSGPAEEPLWKAIRTGGGNIREWWEELPFAPWFKWTVAIVVLIVLANSVPVAAFPLIPIVAMALGVYAIFYAIYWVVRTIMGAYGVTLSTTVSGPAPPATPPPATAPPSVAAPPPQIHPARRLGRRLRRSRHSAQADLLAKTPRQRFTELTGSLLFSAIVVAVVSVVTSILSANASGQSFDAGVFAALALTGIAGCWAVLIPAKFWEGREGEQALRRFVMLMIGLALGLAAFGIDKTMMIHHSSNDFGEAIMVGQGFDEALFGPQGSLLLPSYLLYYGTLFLIVAWWRQADPLRSSRLRLWPTCVTLLFAWIACYLWPFPLAWGAMIAVTISLGVQLASPWIQRNRRSLAETI